MDYNNFDHPYLYSLYSLEDSTKCVRFVEISCIVIMQNYFKEKHLFFNPVISIKELFPILKSLKTNYEFQFRDLIKWIEEEHKNEIDLLKKIVKERFIDFDNLIQLFPIDGLLLIHTKDQWLIKIKFWESLRKIDSLPIFPISEEDKIYTELVARGKIFIKYAIGHYFL
ncbi:P-loop containing nucleoside triphosphate hydrolase protein [Gigaspora margarita]|uniref:P-loop containing nucleoside triphosphate hydrolase protein n=1 Tax=Gigaspora margarita TaxID=4874 RepID=A0A8H4A7R9_GIGMA|nr:P-loop containing nucleoside triphosphate hydrolase protein [Gigaspora margarita]